MRLNQNCDILIRFRTPPCQMNDDRQIAGESRQISNFCSLFNSEVTAPILTKISHDVEALV